jgi:hypothetical protein
MSETENLSPLEYVLWHINDRTDGAVGEYGVYALATGEIGVVQMAADGTARTSRALVSEDDLAPFAGFSPAELFDAVARGAVGALPKDSEAYDEWIDAP